MVLPIKPGTDTVYLSRSVDGYAVAIPFDDERNFNESFVGISFSTNMLNYNDNSFKVLYLFMNESGDLDKFCYISTEFIDINNRESLLNNPYIWIDSWIEMFGDSKKKFLVTDVLAELISLREAYKIDKSAKWQGPKDGTHDIVLKDKVIEVKSTTNKTNSYISINSRFQINPEINEYLYFVRLEPKPYSNSIDSLIAELTALGYDENELEENLKMMGYRKGNRTRKIAYAVLSLVSYKVEETSFPVISIDALNDMTKSKNIVGYNFKIDLSTFEGETIL